MTPVYFINHPIIEQRTIIYDHSTILDWLEREPRDTCPQSRQKLEGDQRKLESIKMEVLLFILEAEKHLEILTDSFDDQQIKADIQDFMKKMRQAPADIALVANAEKILTQLTQDDAVEISLDMIANLLGFGIKANYSKQKVYAEKRVGKEKEAEKKERADGICFQI